MPPDLRLTAEHRLPWEAAQNSGPASYVSGKPCYAYALGHQRDWPQAVPLCPAAQEHAPLLSAQSLQAQCELPAMQQAIASDAAGSTPHPLQVVLVRVTCLPGQHQLLAGMG